MSKTKKENTGLTFAEFGRRIALVRKEIFRLKQVEFAPLIGTTQGLLSRLELGIGGNMHIIFDLVNFLNKNGLQGHLLFRETFDVKNMKTKNEILVEIEGAERALKKEIDTLKIIVG